MLVRSLSSPTGLPPVLVGVVVSLLAGLCAIAGLWHLAARVSDENVADRAVVLFAFLPSAFVMSMVYADEQATKKRVPPPAFPSSATRSARLPSSSPWPSGA